MGIVLLLLALAPATGAIGPLGFKLGTSLSNYHGDGTGDNPGLLAGFEIGVSEEKKLAEGAFGQLELLFVSHGGTREYDYLAPEGAIHFKESLRLFSLQLSASLRLGFPSERLEKYSALVGAGFSITPYGYADVDWSWPESPSDKTGQTSGPIDNLGCSSLFVTGGLQRDLRLFNRGAFIELRYTVNFASDFNNDNISPGPGTSYNGSWYVLDSHNNDAADLTGGQLTLSIGFRP
ncbi:MAG TPA: hypothetical protein PLF13_01615 [candidate division Zixibacteria bacterium]|nr:hypothetical protein [candidate division Zixibacteria bacterium]